MAESPLFTVRGRVWVRERDARVKQLGADSQPVEPLDDDFHTPWGGAWVQVMDLDRFRHDLVAEGPTQADGTFEVDFTTDEFNLDTFEDETWPELWIVVSRTTADGERVAVDSRGVPRSLWVGQSVVIDDIVVDEWMYALPLTEEVPAANSPGGDRIELTPELLEQFARRVEPEVERWTGWTNLVDDVSFEVSDDLADAMMSHVPIDLGFVTRGLVNQTVGRMVAALYEPMTKTIFVHPRCEAFNSEGMKVVLGHELVHAGQFRECEDLVGTIARSYAQLLGQIEDSGTTDVAEMIQESDMNRVMTELEGQAMWVQQQIQAGRPMASLVFSELSIPGQLLSAVARRLGFDLKLDQYARGAALFAQRKRGAGGPPALAPWIVAGELPLR